MLASLLECAKILTELASQAAVALSSTGTSQSLFGTVDWGMAFDCHEKWPVQDAKARFSELLQTSLAEGPQVVTLRGVETAVLVPMKEWRRLRDRARPGLKTLLLAAEVRGDLNIPPRGSLNRRRQKSRE